MLPSSYSTIPTSNIDKTVSVTIFYKKKQNIRYIKKLQTKNKLYLTYQKTKNKKKYMHNLKNTKNSEMKFYARYNSIISYNDNILYE